MQRSSRDSSRKPGSSAEPEWSVCVGLARLVSFGEGAAANLWYLLARGAKDFLRKRLAVVLQAKPASQPSQSCFVHVQHTAQEKVSEEEQKVRPDKLPNI